MTPYGIVSTLNVHQMVAQSAFVYGSRNRKLVAIEILKCNL